MGRKTKLLVALGFIIGFVGITLAASLLYTPVSDGVTLGAPDGMNATITGDADLNLEDFTEGSDTVRFETDASGNITFQSSGPAWASVDVSNITGTWTSVEAIDAQNDITVNPEDKRSITVGQDIDYIKFRDAGIDNGQVDFVYAGTTGTSKVVVSGLASNTQVGAVEPNTQILQVVTTDSNGVATFDSLPNSEHEVSLQTGSAPSLSNLQDDGSIRYANQTLSVDVDDADFTEDTVTLEWYVDGTLENTTTADSAGTYSAKVGPLTDGDHDYYVEATDEYGKTTTSDTQSFTIDHHDPVITDIQPSGLLDTKPIEISAQVNDTDFSKDGDSLTVVFNLDGSQIDSQTINSNQTVTTSMPDSGQLGGSHSITIDVTDDYGQTSSESTTYSTPSTFYIRNELNYTELVPADGEVRFFAEDAVYSRSAPNGKFNMTGLAVDRDFIVEVQPTNGNFTTRTIYIEGIYEQQNAYVLNTSAVNTIQSRFTLNDPTGRYGSESLLKIQKAINISGNVRYQTIVSDEFGVEGVTAVLQEGQRYELRVATDDFSQSVGPYRAATSETVAVEPGRSDVPLPDGPNPWIANAVIKNDTIEWRYSDTQQETTQLVVWAYERGNKTNTVIANQTYVDLGNASGAGTVPPSRIDQEYVVEFEITRDGETFTFVETLSNRKNLTLPIAQGWQSMIGVGLLILLAGAFSVLNAGIGAVIVTMVGGILYFIGFLSGATSAMAIALAFMVAILGHALSSSR